MAYATHLTIATGDHIRLRFPQNIGQADSGHEENVGQEENDIRQEVQVSITYALDGEETDLAAIAAEKADEVKCAHEAAWHQIGAFSRRHQPPCTSASSSCHAAGKQDVPPDDRQDVLQTGAQEALPANGRQGPEPNGHSQKNGQQGDFDPSSLLAPRPTASLRHRAPAKLPAGTVAARECLGAHKHPGDRKYPGAREHRQGDPAAQPDAPQSGGHAAALPVHDATPPVLELISQPQKILIRSLAHRIGLTPVNLEEMLWNQYQQRHLGQLTQPQAKAVIQALELCERSSRIAAEEPLPGSENQLTDAIDPAEQRDEEMIHDNDWEVQEADMPHYA